MGKKGCVFIVLILLCGRILALDLTVIGGVGNFSFDTTSASPISGSGDTFKGFFYPLVKINLKDQLSDTFGFSATVERNPLERNVLSCEMTINADFLTLSVGPYFSLFNSWTTLFRPGVTAGVGLEFPGIFFINIKGSVSFGSISTNDYALEAGRFAIGFWLPNVICTLNLTTNAFLNSAFPITQDELLRISYRADIFEKNHPYTISFEMGYQYIKRAYLSGARAGEDLIREAFLGFETSFNIKPNLAIIVGAEIPVFVWGKPPLTKAKDHWFFEAFAGFTWTIIKKP